MLKSFAAAVALSFTAVSAGAGCSGPLNHRLNTLQGEPADLCSYQGKVVMVVNTASYCGNTPQYKGLESLYEKYKDRGLVVLGFPANDFGGQEPGSNKEVADFCERTYHVRFPMFTKTSVAPKGDNPIIPELAAATGDWPEWNFHKYLIDRDGKQIKSFAASMSPTSPEVVSAIEKFLQAN